MLASLAGAKSWKCAASFIITIAFPERLATKALN